MKRFVLVPVLIAVAGLAMFAVRTSPPLPAVNPSASMGSVSVKSAGPQRFDDGLRTVQEAVVTRALAPRN